MVMCRDSHPYHLPLPLQSALGPNQAILTRHSFSIVDNFIGPRRWSSSRSFVPHLRLDRQRLCQTKQSEPETSIHASLPYSAHHIG